MPLFGLHSGIGRGGGPLGPSIKDFMFVTTGNGDTSSIGRLYKMEINGENTLISKTELYAAPATSDEIVGVTSDVLNNHVYFQVDSASTTADQILRCDLDGTNLTVIHGATASSYFCQSKRPNGLAVSPVDNKMWYGDGFWGTIRESDLDGTNQTTHITTGSSPNLATINPLLPSGGEVGALVTNGGVRSFEVDDYAGTFVDGSGNIFFNGEGGIFDTDYFYASGGTGTLQRVGVRPLNSTVVTTTNGIAGAILGMSWYDFQVNSNVFFINSTGNKVSFVTKLFTTNLAVTDMTLDGTTYPTDMIDIHIARHTL